MKRSHRIVLVLIAALAVATFLFGVLQFLVPRQEPARPAAPPTNQPASTAPVQ